MQGATRTYIAIDLKSFYASVECVDRGLDPLTTNLVVADKSRTEKTICLAAALEKERRMQEAQLAIKRRFGKNAILKGLNFEEGATAKERNELIGGHKA
jgi:nucleotidyltransferase/DNA polymerase involved in DNA repair